MPGLGLCKDGGIIALAAARPSDAIELEIGALPEPRARGGHRMPDRCPNLSRKVGEVVPYSKLG